jgi:phosphopantothenoylcysteine decarboxylase/phosphopantothenate--cysteine ligase
MREDGWRVVEPASGLQACGSNGPGRLPEPAVLFDAIAAGFSCGDRRGRLVVTAGATREPIDAVRFLSNHSTGKMGVAIAAAARTRFAEVVLIHGALAVPVPAGVRAVPALSVAGMLEALRRELPQADALVMAAAVSDFTPAEPQSGKLKKEGRETLTLQLVRTPDLLVETAPLRAGRIVTIGFAMETERLEENARSKLEKKGLDAILANPLGETDAGFAVDTNRLLWLGRDGSREDLGLATKAAHAEYVVEKISGMLDAGCT